MAIVTICVGCNNPINDMYHLIVGNQFYWHLGCLKCTVCQCMLQMENKCYMNNGKFYCIDDYTSLFKQSANFPMDKQIKTDISEQSNQCRKCTKPIDSNDYVINISNNTTNKVDVVPSNSLYHLNCFACAECHVLISPGHPYGIYNQDIYCTQHYLNQLNVSQPQYTLLDNASSMDTSVQHSTNFANKTIINSQLQPQISTGHNVPSPINTSTSLILPATLSMSSSSMSSSSSTSSSSLSPTQKTSNSRHSSFKAKTSEYSRSHTSHYLLSKKKRVRTSFKHQQLRIMKAHFQINQNPDSKDLKELSERTGLQKRVLQVWFQNSRAKQRKSSGSCGLSMHQLGQGMIGQSNGVSADSSINLEDDEMFSDEEEEEEGLEVDTSSDDKDQMSGDSRGNLYNNGGQQHFGSNSLVDFYHY